ncbi:hypothetical protein ETH_00037505 [Eimeria tenella]|uniref:Uncharacterized protein n=1 Tax=Eimeria tenella TaxID=5802 RepID=U6KUG7_EIMTE|nr:hypothetical protein ETH_00037505 [Eimeria tenella]CDJ41601.1 hypothetical protein ETH_00037505 [Eimeria tenella]|eukprot:XP_013232351.1 hypothetical protein ETH_00037505 [Eimeria tenella]
MQDILERPSSSSSSSSSISPSGRREERKGPKRRPEKEAEGPPLGLGEARELRGLLTLAEQLQGGPPQARALCPPRIAAVISQASEALLSHRDPTP